MRTTQLCKTLYLELLEHGFTEEELARRIHDRCVEHEIGLENAFDQVVLSLCRRHGVRIPEDFLDSSRRAYSRRSGEDR